MHSGTFTSTVDLYIEKTQVVSTVCMLLFTLLLLDVVLNVVGGKTFQSSLIASCLIVVGFWFILFDRLCFRRFTKYMTEEEESIKACLEV